MSTWAGSVLRAGWTVGTVVLATMSLPRRTRAENCGRDDCARAELAEKYPEIWSLDDGMAEDDQAGWQAITKEPGGQIQLVDDGGSVINPEIFGKGIKDGIANAILIKLNQIGTVTEMPGCIERARANGYGAVISRRSGETGDTSIADLAGATGMGQIKTDPLAGVSGSPNTTGIAASAPWPCGQSRRAERGWYS